MSNFEKVVDFNKKFNVKRYTTLNKNILEKDKDLVKFRLDLILEEVYAYNQLFNRPPNNTSANGNGLSLVSSQGGLLGLGQLDNCIVTCTRHAWKFDVNTGECVSHPGRAVARFDVRIEGDEVQVLA